mmetsp:Transcript_5402/g.17903  ORF Transcript_5402/g.17903 Transcript_5402/m.17903 type:complete len:254 (-) Transcript_5402:472-1233(-)
MVPSGATGCPESGLSLSISSVQWQSGCSISANRFGIASVGQTSVSRNCGGHAFSYSSCRAMSFTSTSSCGVTVCHLRSSGKREAVPPKCRIAIKLASSSLCSSTSTSSASSEEMAQSSCSSHSPKDSPAPLSSSGTAPLGCLPNADGLRVDRSSTEPSARNFSAPMTCPARSACLKRRSRRSILPRPGTRRCCRAGSSRPVSMPHSSTRHPRRCSRSVSAFASQSPAALTITAHRAFGRDDSRTPSLPPSAGA